MFVVKSLILNCFLCLMCCELYSYLNQTKTHIYIIHEITESQRNSHILNFTNQFFGNNNNNYHLQNRKNYFTFIQPITITNLTTTVLNQLIQKNIISNSWITEKNSISGTKYRTNRVACQLSHIRTLKHFLTSKYQHAIIFEDDIEINNKFSRGQIHQIIKTFLNFSSEWDGVYLGFCSEFLPINIEYNSTNYTNIYGNVSFQLKYTHVRSPLCRHAILYSRRLASLVIDSYLPIQSPGDWLLRNISCTYNLRVIRPKTPLFHQVRTKLGSTMNNSNKLRTFLKYTNFHCPSSPTYQKDLNSSLIKKKTSKKKFPHATNIKSSSSSSSSFSFSSLSSSFNGN